jgi:2-dehydro-3-deoxy-D-gluconate 5-dehydrogenase
MGASFDLHGKIALVTGGGTGLGRGMAEGLASAGADLALVDRTDESEAAAAVRASGREALVINADLSGQGVPADVVAQCVKHFGRIDILVNNAGIIRRTPAIDFAEKDWDDVMGINARAVFLMCQAAARDMRTRNSGRIINIASLLAFQGGILVPSYAASKGAVAQLTKALANEWATLGITVNAIAPGYMATNNTAPLRADATRSKAILDRIPAGRWGTPEDLQGAVVFLASPAGAYVTGHVLVVDGGWLAR